MPDPFSFRASKCRDTRRMHQTFVAQFTCSLDIDRAPDASESPRRESNGATKIINGLANSINPTETERFIQRFRPGNARFTRVFLVIADPQLSRSGVIFFAATDENSGVI